MTRWLMLLVLVRAQGQNQGLVIDPFEDLPAVSFDEAVPTTEDWYFARRYNGGGSLNLRIDKDRYSGSGALRVDYEVVQTEGWGGFLDFGTILDTGSYFSSCAGASHMSLRYKILEPQSLPGRAHLRLILLDGSHCDDDSCWRPPGQALENYYRFHYVLDDEECEWREIRAELNGTSDSSSSFWRTGLTGVVGNDKLDGQFLQGWRLEISIDSQGSYGSNSSGSFLVDHLACEGDDVIGAPFRLKRGFLGAGNAWNDKSVLPDYLTKWEQNKTVATLANDRLRLDYVIEQTDAYKGGSDAWTALAPRRSYYNLTSNVTKLSVTVDTLRSQTSWGRGSLRFILFDTSDCDDAKCGAYNGGTTDLENYLSFTPWTSLLDERGRTVVEIPFKGDLDKNSPFWNPVWNDVKGNAVLDPEYIKGYRFEIHIDAKGDVGSTTNGSVALGDLYVQKVSAATTATTNECSPLPGVKFHITSFEMIEFATLTCCDQCYHRPDCRYYATDSKNCYVASTVPSSEFELLEEDRALDDIWDAAMIPSRFGTLCEMCECQDDVVNCSGKGLAGVPRVQTSDDRIAAATATVLDLSNNKDLSMLPVGSLLGFDNLERLILSRNIRYIAPSVLLTEAPALAVVTMATETVSNVIASLEESFDSECCSVDASKTLAVVEDGIPKNVTLYFCHMDMDAPGRDAFFEPFIHYIYAEMVRQIFPSSKFMAEAAKSVSLCAEYCAMDPDCNYYTYDNRWKLAEPRCQFNKDQGIRERIDGSKDDYADPELRTPGFVSGMPPRTRALVRDAVVHANSSLVTAEIQENPTDDYWDDTTTKKKTAVATYGLYLGSLPTRGAVWVEPRVSASYTLYAEAVIFDPPRIVWYAHHCNETATVTVIARGVDRAETLPIVHDITACDAAFREPETRVFSEVFVAIEPSAKSDESKNEEGDLPQNIALGILLAGGVAIFVVGVLVAKDKRATRGFNYIIHVATAPELHKTGLVIFVLADVTTDMLSYAFVVRQDDDASQAFKIAYLFFLVLTVGFAGLSVTPVLIYSWQRRPRTPTDDPDDERDSATTAQLHEHHTSPMETEQKEHDGDSSSDGTTSIISLNLEEEDSAVAVAIAYGEQQDQQGQPTSLPPGKDLEEETPQKRPGLFRASSSQWLLAKLTGRLSQSSDGLMSEAQLEEYEDMTTFLLLFGEDVPMLALNLTFILDVKKGHFNVQPLFLISFCLTLIVLGTKLQKVLNMHETFDQARDFLGPL